MSYNNGTHYFNSIELMRRLMPPNACSAFRGFVRLSEHNRKVAINRQGITLVERLRERKSAALMRVEGE
jgi:hypothetical protein